jgi:cytochrome c553
MVLLGGGVAVVLLGGLFIWSGLFDVAATSKHPWPVAWLLHYAMERSVAFHARDRETPDLDDEALLLRGATHYASGCAPCHGAPGELASPIAQQMTPVPPGLYSAGRDFTPGQLFWIIKNGIKMTAMPAWPARGRDDEIWAMVAFVRHLPDYNTAAFGRLTGRAGGANLLSGRPSASAGQADSFNAAACAGCHGADGDGRQGAFPRIAGLSSGYIAAALRHFRDGSRPSGFMQPVAAALSDSEITEAATYFASQRPKGLAETSQAVTAPSTDAGAVAAQPCRSCHSHEATRRDPTAPDLAGQPNRYLAEQFSLLRSGERPVSSPEVRAAHQQDDSQLDALAAYLSGLAPCGAAAASCSGTSAP